MCGIFGGIGKVDPAIIKHLFILNESRGKDSAGFFCGDGSWWKKAGDPFRLMHDKDYLKYSRKFRDQWFVCGHTRFGTRGAKSTDNAHPFEYGKYVGIHNGIISSAPASYAVDSMYLWDLLDKHNGNYQKAWEDVSGYWGLAWTDGLSVYLQVHRHELALVRSENVVYFSSSGRHLKAATGLDGIEELKEGETLKFMKDGTFKQLPKFESNIKYATQNYRKWPILGDIEKDDKGDEYKYDGNNEWVLVKDKTQKKYGAYSPMFAVKQQGWYAGSHSATTMDDQKKTKTSRGGKGEWNPTTTREAARCLLRLDELSEIPYHELTPETYKEIYSIEKMLWARFANRSQKDNREELLIQAVMMAEEEAEVDRLFGEFSDSTPTTSKKSHKQTSQPRHQEVHDQVSRKTALVPIQHDPKLWQGNQPAY